VIEQELTEQIIGAAMAVHRHWGPGLLEDIYRRSMCVELKLRDIKFETEKSIPLVYRAVPIGDGLRLDLIVGNKVVVELKAANGLAAIHEAQLLTYLRLTQCQVGLLINFNVPVLKDGIRRMRL